MELMYNLIETLCVIVEIWNFVENASELNSTRSDRFESRLTLCFRVLTGRLLDGQDNYVGRAACDIYFPCTRG